MILDEIIEIGSHNTQRLVDQVATVGLDNDLSLDRTPSAPPMLSDGNVGHFAHQRNVQTIQILASTNCMIHRVAQEQESTGHHQSENKGHQHDHVLLGCRRYARSRWRLDDTGVPRRVCARQFVFFTLLEQEDIQSLLHCLLALNRGQHLRLARI